MIAKSLKTELHSLHLEHSARMVAFAGYDMPVQYQTGIIAEHLHTRSAAGLFDVSHMGQLRVHGDDAAAALESCVPANIVGLQPGRQRYGFLTNHDGGILDDLMIANDGDSYRLVVNAACKDNDLAWLNNQIGDRVCIEPLQNLSLLALQGPSAQSVLSGLATEAETMNFMDARKMTILDTDCFVSRSGYTGEDGYELSLPSKDCERVARALLNHEDVLPVGLGARDSLRLEAGLCLYGQDIDAEVTPIEAGLGWAISASRRRDGARAGGFPGADIVLEQMSAGTDQQRVGIRPEGPAPLRSGVTLQDEHKVRLGKITSGSFGASFDGPIAMAYVDKQHAVPGTQVWAEVRNKLKQCVVCELPFVPHRYKRG